MIATTANAIVSWIRSMVDRLDIFTLRVKARVFSGSSSGMYLESLWTVAKGYGLPGDALGPVSVGVFLHQDR